MFEKASKLLATKGNVILKPGADDASFIVAGRSNNVHSVTPGKGGSLTCDKTCTNHATKICEHILAVAQVKGILPPLISWFKRNKRRPTMMGMVEQNGPKSGGKKPWQRMRTNSKAEPIKEYVNLLGDGASRGQVRTIQPGKTSYQHPLPSSCRSTSTSTPHIPLIQSLSNRNCHHRLEDLMSSDLSSMATGYFSSPSDLTTPQATSSQFSSVSLPVWSFP